MALFSTPVVMVIQDDLDTVINKFNKLYFIKLSVQKEERNLLEFLVKSNNSDYYRRRFNLE